MRHLLLILLSIASMQSCKDERTGSERALETLSIYLLSRPDLLRPNYCEPPQIILEEGQTYNITLEAGKRFYIDFDVRSKFRSNVLLDLELTINKDSTTSFDYISEDDCDSEVRPLPVKPFINDSTQVKLKSRAYGYSNGFGMNTDGYYIILNSGKEILSISYSSL